MTTFFIKRYYFNSSDYHNQTQTQCQTGQGDNRASKDSTQQGVSPKVSIYK